MEPEIVSTGEMLEQWREATRAAELAERLAKMAAESADRADQSAAAAHEIARLAERAAKSAERAAVVAREAANRAKSFAEDSRASKLADATGMVDTARREEAAARERYHNAELEERRKQGL